jgi:hypothetical protein
VSPGRRLAFVVVVLLVAALVLWTSAQLVWLHAAQPGLGATATGGQLHPELAAVATVAVAAVAAVVATARWPRRVLGVLVAVAGVWPAWLCAGALADGRGVRPAGPVLGLVAGLLLLLAGLLTVRWSGAMAGMGGRYAALGASRRGPDREGDWWRAMDAGDDPTTSAPPADPGREA